MYSDDYSINCQSSSSSLTSSASVVEIQTELGPITGLRIRTYLNNRAIGFMGIPYALPPIGNLRFKVCRKEFFFCFCTFKLISNLKLL